MRYVLLILVTILLLPYPVFAGQLEDGIAACSHGDFDEAYKILKPLSDTGDPYAEEQIGIMYAFGEIDPVDAGAANKLFTSAFKQLLPLAKQGDAKAQRALSVLYFRGWGVGQSDVDALYWRRKAAEGGDMDAEADMGWTYEEGRGVQQDDEEAAKWYRKAAKQGDISASIILSKFIEGGIWIKKNPSESQERFRLAEKKVCAQEKENGRLILSPAELQSIKPIAWTSSYLADLNIELVDAYDRETMHFQKNGNVTISTINSWPQEHLISWQILSDGRLQIYDGFEDRPYTELTLISRDAKMITALDPCNSILKYKILPPNKRRP